MNIIYCCLTSNESCEKVKRVIHLLVTTDDLDTFSRLEDFEKDLRTRLSARSIIIIHAGSKKHLDDILAARELLMDHKIILILPDTNPETVAMGHVLRPRFITYDDSDFLEMASVLRHLLFPSEGEAKKVGARR